MDLITPAKTLAEALRDGVWTCVCVVFWPWVTNHASFKHVIKADGNLQKRVDDWCNSKSAELSNVSVSGGLTAAVLTGAFAWPQGKYPIPDLSRACWYSGLVLALTAITLATQQNISLTRAKVNPKGWVYLRHILNVRGDDLDVGQPEPSWAQLYIWQVPVMLLNFSNTLLVLGILVLVFHNEDRTMMISVGAAAAFAGINYLGSTLVLYNNALQAEKID